MIFTPDLADKILRGEKTVTRRRREPGVPCRYLAGRDYAVQPGRAKKSIARIRILTVHREDLGLMFGETEARLEGFASRSEFVSKWMSLYGEWNPDQLVWRIEFEIVGSDA